MRVHTILLGIIDLGVWYAFIYLWIFTIKNPVNLYVYSGILLAAMIIGIVACPLIYIGGRRNEPDDQDTNERP